MHEVFPEFFRPSETNLATLWKSCIFIIDANVLLNLYRYSPSTRTELKKSLLSIKDRIFITHRAAEEFLKKRLTVTSGQAKEYSPVIDQLNKIKETLANQKRHPFLPEDKSSSLTSNIEELIHILEEQQSAILSRLHNDEILQFVDDLFLNKVGKEYTKDELDALLKEGEKRYTQKIPPGYKDENKDCDGDAYRKYGDFIIWKQLIDKAKDDGHSVIFITDDRKEDWWLEQSGQTIGPRTELRGEFIQQTQKDFWMYTVDRFIEEVARKQNSKVNSNAIQEIIEFREQSIEDERARSSSLPYKAITREEMLNRIRASEAWSRKNSEGFVGLLSFVKTHLGHAGYDYSSSFDMIRQLENEGEIEVYDHRGEGHLRSIRAVRLKSQGGPLSYKPFQMLADRN